MDSTDPLDWISALKAELLVSMFAIAAIRTFAVMRVCPRTSGEPTDGPVFGVAA
jgi:hypothetical protein